MFSIIEGETVKADWHSVYLTQMFGLHCQTLLSRELAFLLEDGFLKSLYPSVPEGIFSRAYYGCYLK